MAMTIRALTRTFNLDQIRDIEILDEDTDNLAVSITWANGDISYIDGPMALAFDHQLMIFQMHVDAAVGVEFAREIEIANAESARSERAMVLAARRKRGE
jgi:hypothetical protein